MGGPPPLLLTREGGGRPPAVVCEVRTPRLSLFGRTAPPPSHLLTSAPLLSISTKKLLVHRSAEGTPTIECRGPTLVRAGELCMRTRGLMISNDLAIATSARGPVRIRWAVQGENEEPQLAKQPITSLGDAVRWLKEAPPPLVLAQRCLTGRSAGRSGRPPPSSESASFAGAIVASSCSFDLFDGALICQGANGWATVPDVDGGTAQRAHPSLKFFSTKALRMSQTRGSPLSLRSESAATRQVLGMGIATSPLARKFGEAACWRFPMLTSALIVPAVVGRGDFASQSTLELSSSDFAVRARADVETPSARLTPPPHGKPSGVVLRKVRRRRQPSVGPPDSPGILPPPLEKPAQRKAAKLPHPPPIEKAPAVGKETKATKRPRALPPQQSSLTRGVSDRSSVSFGLGRGGERIVAVRLPFELPDTVRKATGLERVGVRASGSCTIHTAGSRKALVSQVAAVTASRSTLDSTAHCEETTVYSDLLDSPIGDAATAWRGRSNGPETCVELAGKMTMNRVGFRAAGGLRLGGGPLTRPRGKPDSSKTKHATPPPPPPLSSPSRMTSPRVTVREGNDDSMEQVAAKELMLGSSISHPRSQMNTRAPLPPNVARPKPPAPPPAPPAPSVQAAPTAGATGNAAIQALPLRASISVPVGEDARFTLRMSHSSNAITCFRPEFKSRLAVWNMSPEQLAGPIGRLVRNLKSSRGKGNEGLNGAPPSGNWALTAVGGAAVGLERRRSLSASASPNVPTAANLMPRGGSASGASSTPESSMQTDKSTVGGAGFGGGIQSSTSPTSTGHSGAASAEPVVAAGAEAEKASATAQVVGAIVEEPQPHRKSSHGALVADVGELSFALRLTRIASPIPPRAPSKALLEAVGESMQFPPLTELTIGARLRAPLQRAMARQSLPEVVLEQQAKFSDAASLSCRTSLPFGTRGAGGRAIQGAKASGPSVRAAISLAL